MAEENAPVEETTEDVTLPSEESEVEKTEDQTERGSVESDTPREGDNTSEEAEETSLSPRRERDLKRLNRILDSKEKRIKELESKIGSAEPEKPQLSEQKSYVPPMDMSRADPVLALRQEIEQIKQAQQQEQVDKWYEQDDAKWQESLAKYPELEKYPNIAQKTRAAAQLEQGEGWDHADYDKHLKATLKDLGLAEERGMEKAQEREQVVESSGEVSSRKHTPKPKSEYSEAKQKYVRNPGSIDALTEMMSAIG